jgi:hypothetical protein
MPQNTLRRTPILCAERLNHGAPRRRGIRSGLARHDIGSGDETMPAYRQKPVSVGSKSVAKNLFHRTDWAGHLNAAGAVASDPARLRPTEPVGDGAGQQVPAVPTAESPELDLRSGRRRDRCLDAGGPGRRLRGGARAADRRDPSPRNKRRSHPRRRHHGAGAGENEDRHRPDLDLCPR